MDQYGIGALVFETYVADIPGTRMISFQALAPDQQTNKPMRICCHGAGRAGVQGHAKSPPCMAPVAVIRNPQVTFITMVSDGNHSHNLGQNCKFAGRGFDSGGFGVKI
jgi:hypothetical protein